VVVVIAEAGVLPDLVVNIQLKKTCGFDRLRQGGIARAPSSFAECAKFLT
jgi:hypothetical protein